MCFLSFVCFSFWYWTIVVNNKYYRSVLQVYMLQTIQFNLECSAMPSRIYKYSTNFNMIISSQSLHCFFCKMNCRAVVDHSEGKDLPSVSVENFEYFPGRGLTATVNSIEVPGYCFHCSTHYSNIHFA